MENIKNVLNTKLVDDKSPVWIGFQHFLLSNFLFYFILIIVIFGSASLGLYYFDFMFGIGWQIKTLFFISLFLGTTASSMIFRKRTDTSKKVSFFGTLWFIIFLFVWFILLSDRPSSGVPEDFWLIIAMLIEYYVVSRIFLRNKIIKE